MDVLTRELILSMAHLPEPEILRIAGGSIAVFSACRPEKSGVNEDAAAVFALPDGRGVLAVADGLGGHAAGAEAARIAMDELSRSLADQAGPAEPLRTALLNGIETANVRIGLLGVGAATTFAAVEIDQRAIRPYHVGDSEILLIGQRGKVKLQTVSHSPVAYAVEAGMISSDEAIHHADRHLVSNIVGSSDMRIEVGPGVPLASRDTLLLATDGLFDNLYQEEIIELVRKGPLPDAARRLVELARARMDRVELDKPSKPDDLTFVLYRPDTSPSSGPGGR